MKCLLCNRQFNGVEELRKHFLEFHKVDAFNHFFQKLFKSGCEIFKPRKCFRCQGFLPTTKFIAVHDFFKHYD